MYKKIIRNPLSIVLTSIAVGLGLAVFIENPFVSNVLGRVVTLTPPIPAGFSPTTNIVAMDMPVRDSDYEITLLDVRSYASIDWAGSMLDSYAETNQVYLEMYVRMRNTGGSLLSIPFNSFVVIDKNGSAVQPLYAGADSNRYEILLYSVAENDILRLDKTQHLILVYPIEDAPHDLFLQIKNEQVSDSPLIHYYYYPRETPFVEMVTKK